MARKAFKPEQIINKLREAEVLLSQGPTNKNFMNNYPSERITVVLFNYRTVFSRYKAV